MESQPVFEARDVVVIGLVRVRIRRMDRYAEVRPEDDEFQIVAQPESGPQSHFVQKSFPLERSPGTVRVVLEQPNICLLYTSRCV